MEFRERDGVFTLSPVVRLAGGMQLFDGGIDIGHFVIYFANLFFLTGPIKCNSGFSIDKMERVLPPHISEITFYETVNNLHTLFGWVERLFVMSFFGQTDDEPSISIRQVAPPLCIVWLGSRGFLSEFNPHIQTIHLFPDTIVGQCGALTPK